MCEVGNYDSSVSCLEGRSLFVVVEWEIICICSRLPPDLVPELLSYTSSFCTGEGCLSVVISLSCALGKKPSLYNMGPNRPMALGMLQG